VSSYYPATIFTGLGLIAGLLLATANTGNSSSSGNVTVTVTATGGTATATGGAADATGGMNENNDDDTNTATNTNAGRSIKTDIERMVKKILRFLHRISIILRRRIGGSFMY
jgi:hypothetical protein